MDMERDYEAEDYQNEVSPSPWPNTPSVPLYTSAIFERRWRRAAYPSTPVVVKFNMSINNE